MPLMKHKTFICLDCETTGLDINKDRIIEVAAVKFTLDETLGQYESLIDPKVAIPAESMAIHHITQEMVTDQPFAEEILPTLIDFIEDHPIIGHSVSFDIDILAANLERLHKTTRIKKTPFFDTLRLARLYGQSPSNSLEVLRRHFNIEEEGAHRAMSDVIVNIQVFKHLVSQFKTYEELVKALSKPIKMKHMPLGKHKGRALKEIPLQYLRWASHQDFDQDLLYSLRSEINRRKKSTSFSNSSSPFASS